MPPTPLQHQVGSTTEVENPQLRFVALPMRSNSIGHDRHGFRSDPFNTYPIDFRDSIPPAIDYFLGFYGPAHVIRPEVLTAEAGAVVLHQYFQYALQNSLMFEALIALSQANLTIQQWQWQCPAGAPGAPGTAPNRDVLFHYSRSVARLRGLLGQRDGCMRDAVMFGIIALMGVDFLMNDVAAFEMHLGGLRRIVALRGGLDQLGWPTILKPYLIGLEGFWAYMSKHKQQQGMLSLPTPPDNMDLRHPYHRYPIAELGELIRPLPTGFQNLALNYRLSVPVITLIHRRATKDQYIDQLESSSGSTNPGVLNAMNMQETEYAVRLLACSKEQEQLTLIERAVCIGILISILDTTRTERFSPLYIRHIQHHAEELCQWEDLFLATGEAGDDDDNDLAEFYLWVALDIAGTMAPPKMPALPVDYQQDKRFELLMIVVRRYGHLEWDEVLAVLKKFLSRVRCIQSWEFCWRLGLMHLREEEEEEEHREGGGVDSEGSRANVKERSAR